MPTAVLLYPPKQVEAAGSGCAAVVGAVIATVVGVSAASKIVGVPSADWGSQTGSGIQAGSGYGTFFKDCILIPIAIRLAKAMLRNITSSLVDWINNGFEGRPSFVQDLEGLLDDTVDQVVGDYIQNQLGLGFLCQSFSLQVRIAIAQSYLPYQKRSACTLSQIKGNIGSIGAGSWDNWLEVTTVPQNNVYGATVLAQDAISQTVAKKIGIQNRKLDWGKGFRSWDVCIEPAGLKTTDPNCKKTETRTPGTVVESQLENTLGSGVRQLELANDIDAIIGALTNQLMSQVIKGAKGLLGAGKSSTGGYSSTSYQDAINGDITDPDLATAIDTGISNLTESSGVSDALKLSTDSGTPKDTASSTTPTADQQAMNLTVINISGTITDSQPLLYGLNLSAVTLNTNLTVRTTLKQNGVAVPFLTPFSSFQISYGIVDGALTNQYISSFTDASAAWTNISINAQTQYVFKFLAYKRGGAAPGTYTLETTVADENGSVFKTQTDSFIVQ